MKARDVIRALEADGWREARTTGSHRQFRHPTKAGTVTVSYHRAGAEIPPGTLRMIERQAGISLRKE